MTQANAARLAFRCCQPSASITSAREEGDFPLPEPVNGAILDPKLTESGECRVKSPPRPIHSLVFIHNLCARRTDLAAHRGAALLNRIHHSLSDDLKTGILRSS